MQTKHFQQYLRGWKLLGLATDPVVGCYFTAALLGALRPSVAAVQRQVALGAALDAPPLPQPKETVSHPGTRKLRVAIDAVLATAGVVTELQVVSCVSK